MAFTGQLLEHIRLPQPIDHILRSSVRRDPGGEHDFAVEIAAGDVDGGQVIVEDGDAFWVARLLKTTSYSWLARRSRIVPLQQADQSVPGVHDPRGARYDQRSRGFTTGK